MADLYTRFVEPGRLAMVSYGPETNKTCVIVDIINNNRVLVEGPHSGVKRQQIPIRWLQMTDLKCEIGRGARQKTLKAAMAEADMENKWKATGWAKKLAIKEFRANMTDFDRFKLMMAKKKKGSLLKKALKKK